jgi:hypothetical protein
MAKKMGRPPLPKDRVKVPLTISIPPAAKVWLRETAEEKRMSISTLVATMIFSEMSR